MLSETFNYLEQAKSIISDKHTRKYLSLSKKDKYQNQIKTWGNNYIFRVLRSDFLPCIDLNKPSNLNLYLSSNFSFLDNL